MKVRKRVRNNRKTVKGTKRRVRVKDTSLNNATASEFKTAMSGVQLCYELATPQTYQLDPQTISLLHGNNNVWSDGEVEFAGQQCNDRDPIYPNGWIDEVDDEPLHEDGSSARIGADAFEFDAGFFAL